MSMPKPTPPLSPTLPPSHHQHYGQQWHHHHLLYQKSQSPSPSHHNNHTYQKISKLDAAVTIASLPLPCDQSPPQPPQIHSKKQSNNLAATPLHACNTTVHNNTAYCKVACNNRMAPLQEERANIGIERIDE